MEFKVEFENHEKVGIIGINISRVEFKVEFENHEKVSIIGINISRVEFKGVNANDFIGCNKYKYIQSGI